MAKELLKDIIIRTAKSIDKDYCLNDAILERLPGQLKK